MKKIFKKVLRFILNRNQSHDIEAIAPSKPLNIFKGNNVYVDGSAILVCPEDSSIEFEGDNYIGKNVEIGSSTKIFVGSKTTIQDRCILLGDIEIGRYCTFAPNIYLSSGRHYYQFKPEFYIRDQDSMIMNDPELAKKHSKKIIIEDDCWLGINVVVMSGITIGKGSVIGANSVVTKNVEPYSIMTGSPAQLIKKRLSFEPKESIDFSSDTDLPYFYSGFYTDLKSLQEYRAMHGIKVMKDFSVCLKSEGKSTISLQIKKLSTTSIRIKYNNQMKEITTEEFIELAFNIENNTIHKFNLLSLENDKSNMEQIVLIKTIKTE